MRNLVSIGVVLGAALLGFELSLAEGSSNSASATAGIAPGSAGSLASLVLTTPLAATSGGTGMPTTTAGDLLVGAAANTWAKVADVATGQVFRSGGVGVAPAWGALTAGDLGTTLSPRFSSLGIGGAAGAASTLTLFGSTSGSQAWKLPATGGAGTLTWPAAATTTAGWVLSNDGTGVLSWAAGGGGGGVNPTTTIITLGNGLGNVSNVNGPTDRKLWLKSGAGQGLYGTCPTGQFIEFQHADGATLDLEPTSSSLSGPAGDQLYIDAIGNMTVSTSASFAITSPLLTIPALVQGPTTQDIQMYAMGDGQSVSIFGADATSTNGSTNDIDIYVGKGKGSGSGGNLNIKAGNAVNGNPGAVFIDGGGATGHLGERVIIRTCAVNSLTPVARLTVDSTGLGTFAGDAIFGATGRQLAQSAADANVVTVTVGAADASYEISPNINVTATAVGLVGTVTYTDETNTSRAQTLAFLNLAGSTVTTLTTTGAYEGVPIRIRCKASNTIVVSTAITSGTYNVECGVRMVK